MFLFIFDAIVVVDFAEAEISQLFFKLCCLIFMILKKGQIPATLPRRG